MSCITSRVANPRCAIARETATFKPRRVGSRMRFALALCLLSLAAPPSRAESVAVRVCFDYACAHEAQARFDAVTLQSVARVVSSARDAEDERSRIAYAVAELYVAAGRQTPIWRDRGGNRNDDTDVAGAMDCIDHAANTTEFLRVMAHAGMLRFHRVGDPVRRVRFFVAEHWSASIIESATGDAHAVDSWFFDPGTPAVVMPLQAWRDGAPPIPREVKLP